MPTVWVLLGALPLLLLREFIRRLAWRSFGDGNGRDHRFRGSGVPVGRLVAAGPLRVAHGEFGLWRDGCGLCPGLLRMVSRETDAVEILMADGTCRLASQLELCSLVLASHLVNFAAPTLMPWIVTAVHGNGEAGAFAACVGIVGAASMFMTGLATYLIPKAAKAFAQGGVDELRPGIPRTAAIIFAVVLGAFTLLVFASGDYLLVLAFGSKYAGYGTAIGVLALGMGSAEHGLNRWNRAVGN